MDIEQSSRKPQFRTSYFWKSVPYKHGSSVKSANFTLARNIDVKFCLSVHRFQSQQVTIIHVQVEKTSIIPYGEADIRILLSDGSSKTEKIDDWFKNSSVFCFSNRTKNNLWRPSIKCFIDWYRFLTEEEWMHVLNQKKVIPLKNLLFSPYGSDVCIVVGDKTLPAHKFVLEHYSPVLCASLKVSVDSKGNNVLSVHDVDFSTMEELLSLMYTGSFKVDNFSTWESVTKVALTYQIDTIQKYCQSKIMKFVNTHKT